MTFIPGESTTALSANALQDIWPLCSRLASGMPTPIGTRARNQGAALPIASCVSSKSYRWSTPSLSPVPSAHGCGYPSQRFPTGKPPCFPPLQMPSRRSVPLLPGIRGMEPLAGILLGVHSAILSPYKSSTRCAPTVPNARAGKYSIAPVTLRTVMGR